MPPRERIPAPIDRPLSRSYLREFSGWSTAYPPGVSEPTSLRIMENTQVLRDGSLRIRPGLRYLSYSAPGFGIDRPVVGSHEMFFLNDSSKAYLIAVRETDNTVGFRVLSFAGSDPEVLSLTEAGFAAPPSNFNFSSATTYVKYLQIDNKIMALSNAGEPARLFFVGTDKRVRRLQPINRPLWTTFDKLTVVHPQSSWITSATSRTRQNLVRNSSFETGVAHWTSSNSSVVLSQHIDEGYSGGASLLVENTASSNSSAEVRCATISVTSLLVRMTHISAWVKNLENALGASCRLRVDWLNSAGGLYTSTYASSNTLTNDWVRHQLMVNSYTAAASARIVLELTLPAESKVLVDAVMFEFNSTAEPYFDGSTPTAGTTTHSWTGTPFDSSSVANISAAPSSIPPQATPTADTLVSNVTSTTSDKFNRYNYGFFYTFANEVGESMASQITLVKAQRAWSAWRWETPNASGAPSGSETTDPTQAADQLVAYMPEDVYNAALAQGATHWNLYMFSWSDQDPVPVEGMLIATQTLTGSPTYQTHGWLRATPNSVVNAIDSAPLPGEQNRVNYSDPSKASQGLVAADRLVMVYDPSDPATIKWTSNRTGEYLNFTASKGGGKKTLSSGNLYIPACVKLWQNPQSADTLTVLCLGVDSYSTAYYMMPAEVASQSEAMVVMAFEETTATPGTTSPYGVEVLNNALYHPIETELMKSTAANYNINHKSMTDLIANMWSGLRNKEKIVSSQLDNRLYYIVHNRYGAPLEDGCWGNEVWVCDAGKEGGSWSRWLVQGQSLRKIEVDGKIVMSLVRPDGVFCFDESLTVDQVVTPGSRAVVERPIPWAIETNTQGANRAHDAWAHLQQISVIVGNFVGTMRYGVKGYDVHGQPVEVEKILSDHQGATSDGLLFDLEDFLAIKRDMKEWHFYAGSVEQEGTTLPSAGQINLVQYRYTPVSVNVGYEFGSIETFEYGRDVAGAQTSTTTNGVPVPYVDTRRP